MTKNVVTLMVFEDFLMRILFAKKVYTVARMFTETILQNG